MKIPDLGAYTPLRAQLYDRVEMAEGETLQRAIERVTKSLYLSGSLFVGGLALAVVVDAIIVRAIGFVIAFGGVLYYLHGSSLVRKASAARHAEMLAGYTTSRRGFTSFPEVDPTSSMVIRVAGEPILNDAERDSRIRDGLC